MRLEDFMTCDERRMLEDIAYAPMRIARLTANPVRTLERAISHIGRTPNFPTGAAIQIMNKMKTSVLEEKHKAEQQAANDPEWDRRRMRA